MRLIDADALKTLFSDIAKEQPDLTGASETLGKIIDFQPTISPAANWTPCSVALPEKDSLYIVTVRVCLLGATIIMTTVKGFDLKLGWSKSEYEDTVLAWQPLPEPYRGEA